MDSPQSRKSFQLPDDVRGDYHAGCALGFGITGSGESRDNRVGNHEVRMCFQ